MGEWKKTDNHAPERKLALRRYFLDKYHNATPPRVFDGFQGSGLLWSELRKSHAVKSYWGVDLKPKKGRLKIDSMRVLDQPGWAFDVVDLDAYGSPWKHWWALQRNLRGPVTVFLTVGSAGFGGQDRSALSACGLGGLNIPIGMHAALRDFISETCVQTALYGVSIVEIVESKNPGGNARYFGVRLEKATINAQKD